MNRNSCGSRLLRWLVRLPPLMLPETSAAQGAEKAELEKPQLEQHEFVRQMTSFEKTAGGGVFHCATGGGNNVYVTLTVCTPEILRIRMCPDTELWNVKSKLEIKEDWPPCDFTATDAADAVTIASSVLRLVARRARNRQHHQIFICDPPPQTGGAVKGSPLFRLRPWQSPTRGRTFHGVRQIPCSWTQKPARRSLSHRCLFLTRSVAR